MTKSKNNGWPPSRFGHRLRALREQSGMSQAELADATGCHRFTIAKLERGVQEPAWQLVLALCKALAVNASAFMPTDADGQADAEKRPRGRPSKPATDEPAPPKRPRGRPRKGGQRV